MTSGVPAEVRSFIFIASVSVGAACTAPVPPGPPNPATFPRTRPELTNYRETSHYSDVRRFLDSLRALRAPIAFGSIGKTGEGREIPYVITPTRMPVYDRFMSTLDRTPPAAYVIAPVDTAVVDLLRLHGIRVDRSDTAWRARGESFVIDSIITAQRTYQGHHEVRLKGRWERAMQTIPAKSFIVSTAQPRGALIVYLLEPESDDGLTTWNVFDTRLQKGVRFPVRRIFDLSRRGRGAAVRRSTASTSPELQN